MTHEQAMVKAREIWGDRGGAMMVRRAGKPNVYAVGISSAPGKAMVLGSGASFAEAFEVAERRQSGAQVRKQISKAEAKARRAQFWATLKGLFR